MEGSQFRCGDIQYTMVLNVYMYFVLFKKQRFLDHVFLKLYIFFARDKTFSQLFDLYSGSSVNQRYTIPFL